MKKIFITKKNKGKLLFFLGGLLFIFIGCFFKESSSFYCEDFYEAVNKEVFSKNHLKDGAYTWSVFSDLQTQADEEMKELFLETLASDKRLYKIQVVYENAMNIEKRNQDGLGILNKYINKIDHILNVEDLISLISLMEKDLGISILSNVVVDSDYENISSNIVYFYPISFAFGTSSDYYVDENYMTYKAYLKRAMIQLLEVYGYTREEAKEVVADLILFYEEIGSVSKSIQELSDLGSYFHKVSVSELQDIYTNFSIKQYLREQEIDGLEVYGIVDVEQYRKIDYYLSSSYLDLWKDHLLIMVLSYYASYLGDDYERVVIELNDAITGGEIESSLEERTQEMVVSLFSKEMDIFYEEHVITDEKRKYLYGMFEDIRDVYREMLESNKWLSKETIGLAIDKLDNMKIYVGLDGLNKDVSSLDEMNLLAFEEGGSFLWNVLEVIRVRREFELERLESSTSKRMIGESVVNAYYSPMNNAVYIPGAAVSMVDLDSSYYENLGKIGMVIAHEITHGFDGNGSRFDLYGNYKNWWLDQDRENFSDLQKQVIAYYDGYEVLNGRFIDGELTVNENIADLGAVRCIGLVADRKNASIEEKQEMYSSFAKLWASQSNDQYTKLLLLQDTHAPNKYRVNAVLSSLEDFYEVYDVSFWNDMYIKKEKRVQVW